LWLSDDKPKSPLAHLAIVRVGNRYLSEHGDMIGYFLSEKGGDMNSLFLRMARCGGRAVDGNAV